MKIDTTLLAQVARLPLPLRRAAARGAFRVALASGKIGGFGVAPLLMSSLRLPQREAIRLDKEMVFHDWLASLEWLALLNRSPAQVKSDMARVVIDDEDTLVRLAQWQKPVLFTPLHMGCYALGFGRIMERYFPGRRMLILRARDDREIETEVMRRVSETGADMRFLKVSDKEEYLRAIRFAREGAVIVSFVDLPVSYGRPADIELFGQPATLGMGLDALARVSGATVAPISVTSTITGDTVHIGKPFEVSEAGPAERQRVAILVQRHIESSVASHPAEWHMWTRLHEFLRPEPSVSQALMTEAAE